MLSALSFKQTTNYKRILFNKVLIKVHSICLPKNNFLNLKKYFIMCNLKVQNNNSFLKIKNLFDVIENNTKKSLLLKV